MSQYQQNANQGWAQQSIQGIYCGSNQLINNNIGAVIPYCGLNAWLSEDTDYISDAKWAEAFGYTEERNGKWYKPFFGTDR